MRRNIVRESFVVTATTSTANPNLSPQPATVMPKQPNVTADRKTARPKSHEPTEAPKLFAVNSKNEPQALKPRLRNLLHPSWWYPLNLSFTHSSISDLLDHLTIQACVKLTPRLITPISSLPTRAPRPRPILKNVILFGAVYGNMPLEDGAAEQPSSLPAGMRTGCAAESMNWDTFSTSTVSIIIS